MVSLWTDRQICTKQYAKISLSSKNIRMPCFRRKYSLINYIFNLHLNRYWVMCQSNKTPSYVNTCVTFVINNTDTIHKTFGLVCTLITWLQKQYKNVWWTWMKIPKVIKYPATHTHINVRVNIKLSTERSHTHTKKMSRTSTPDVVSANKVCQWAISQNVRTWYAPHLLTQTNQSPTHWFLHTPFKLHLWSLIMSYNIYH